MKKWIVAGLLLTITIGFAFTVQDDTHNIYIWVETTQKDFADGYYEHNIYSTYRPSDYDSLPGDVEFVQRFDYNNDGWMDVIVSNINMLGPRMIRDSFYIYWNQKVSPFFDEMKRTTYPTGGSGEICGTDLNIDGYPDLVVANYRMYPADTTDTLRGGVTIFWGTDSGPDPSYYDSLPGAGMMEAVYIADLNRDGYLDIIAGGSPGSTYVDMFGNWTGMDTVGIWWGQPGGLKGIKYTEDSVTTLVGHIPRHNFEVADFDKDGYYDIVVVNYQRYKDTLGLKLTDTIPHLIFWGSDSGYHSKDTTQLKFLQPQAHGLTVADFNKDGWLDLVFTGLELDTFAFVYYGDGPRKFKGPDTLYPGRCFGGSIAADMNGDGWLDIIFLVGNSEGQEKHPLWIYYGGADGFSEEAKSRVGPKEWGTSGGLFADFNKDGETDLWVDDWITLGGYSGLLWGPDFGTIQQVPNHTDHHGVSWELGNTYDRKSYEEYISSVYDAGSVVNWDGVFAIDSCPARTYITMAVRTGNTPTPDNSWSGWYEFPQRPSRANNWVAGAVPDSLNSRYIQYKATFHYPKGDGSGFPVLYEVRITYPPGIEIFPDRIVHKMPGETVDFHEWVRSYSALQDTGNITISRATQQGWGGPDLLKSPGPPSEPLPDHNGDGIPDVAPLPISNIVDHRAVPTGSLDLYVRRTVPQSAKVGDTDTIVVWATSVNHNTVKDSAYLITIIGQTVGILVEPDQWDTIPPGGSTDYYLWATNLGNGPDTIELRPIDTDTGPPPGGGWTCELLNLDGTPLPDSDGDGLFDLGVFRPDTLDTIPFIARVTAPDTAALQSEDTVFVWGYSSVDSTVDGGKDPARLITYIPAETTIIIDTTIYIQISPPDSDYIYRKFEKYGYPDSTTQNPYPLWIVNRSYRDSITIIPHTLTDTTVLPFTLPYVDLDTTHWFESTKGKGDWRVVLWDKDGNPLKDVNGNGDIDLVNVPPGTTNFQLMVVAPPGLGYIVGTTDTTRIDSVWLKAYTDVKTPPGLKDTTEDTTFIKTTLVPPLDIHNYPNPFRGHKTTFIFSLPDNGKVTLKIFNRAGEHIKTLIKNEFYTMGIHEKKWDGKNEKGMDIGPGTYLYPFYFKAEGKYLPGETLYKKGATIVKKALLLP